MRVLAKFGIRNCCGCFPKWLTQDRKQKSLSAYAWPLSGHPDRPGFPGKGALSAQLRPLEFTQCLLTGSLLQGCHIVVTSRPHTLSHLQSSRWFLSLPKRMVSLDIQGLSEEGVEAFIHR